jgi:hypothetical protein
MACLFINSLRPGLPCQLSHSIQFNSIQFNVCTCARHLFRLRACIIHHFYPRVPHRSPSTPFQPFLFSSYYSLPHFKLSPNCYNSLIHFIHSFISMSLIAHESRFVSMHNNRSISVVMWVLNLNWKPTSCGYLSRMR